MLFKQGDVAAKLEKKSELYKTFPHFYKNENPPQPSASLSERESWWGSSDEGHHIFSGEPFENNPSISGCLISQYRYCLISRCRLPGNAC